MARFLSPGEAIARPALASVGVDISSAVEGDVPVALLERALPADHRALKLEVTVEPAEDGVDTGMAA